MPPKENDSYMEISTNKLSEKSFSLNPSEKGQGLFYSFPVSKTQIYMG